MDCDLCSGNLSERVKQTVSFCPGDKSWDGSAGVAAGFKRRGGGGLFSQPVNILQVTIGDLPLFLFDTGLFVDFVWLPSLCLTWLHVCVALVPRRSLSFGF